MSAEFRNGLLLVEVDVEPKFETDREKLNVALAEIAAADVSLQYTTDKRSGRATLSAISETQLDAALDAVRNASQIDVWLGAPQVAYRETLKTRTEVDYTHKKLTGDGGEFARVKIVFEPNPAGEAVQFESQIVGGAVPEKFFPSIQHGIDRVMASGELAGFPVVDVKAILTDGAFHDVDSSPLAFETAAHAACREALQKGGTLLEPIMEVEVTTPLAYADAITADLCARARVGSKIARVEASAIHALVPLANMFGYGNQLRSLSQGCATFVMRFSHYAPLTPFGDDGPFAPAVGMRA